MPYEVDNLELRRLFSFFQYKAPNIESVSSPYMDAQFHDDILSEMLKSYPNHLFCAQNAKTENELKKMKLEGEQVCARCKRFLCKRMTSSNSKRDKNRKETDLECLLRHIRNAIAHGHVFVIESNKYLSILFEDKNSEKHTTARIMCCKSDLQKWKRILEKYVKSYC